MFQNNCSYYNIVYIGQLFIFCGQKLQEEITHNKMYLQIQNFKKSFI
jgi:hypothetical protein